MAAAKSTKPAPTDSLTKSGGKASIALTEGDLDKVAGGKAKTADKAYTAMDGYIKQ